MKHLSILIPNGQYSIVNIAGALQIIEAANDMSQQVAGKKLFEVDLVASQTPAKDGKGLFSINASKTIREVSKTDLIIVPAVHSGVERVLGDNQEMIQWIREQYKGGAEVASFCIGIYLLAEAGILDGRVCSTHWAHVENLQTMFPLLDVRGESFITDDSGIYTSGGAYAFTNLILYLIEKFGGRELSVQLAKNFMIDPDKGSQSTFRMFNGQKDHKDDTILKVQEYIEAHFDDKFTVDELADDHATIRRTLERRFKKATGNSINEYAQRVRVEAAKKRLEQGRKSVSEIMFEVGYNDGKAFREVFKRYAGISPVEYRNKFSQNAIVSTRR